MKDQADKNTSQLNNLSQLYYVILSKLSFNSNPSNNLSIKFCENMLNDERYKKHSKDKNSKSTKLTIINADNKGLLADCDIFKDSRIELSADDQAILIKQKTLNKNTEWILICLSEGKVIVSKTVPNICNIIRDKNFDFQCPEYRELRDCNKNILDKKNEENDCKNLNQNNEEMQNNGNRSRTGKITRKQTKIAKKVNSNNEINVNNVKKETIKQISSNKDDIHMQNILNKLDDNQINAITNGSKIDITNRSDESQTSDFNYGEIINKCTTCLKNTWPISLCCGDDE